MRRLMPLLCARRTELEVMVKGPQAYKEVEEWLDDGASTEDSGLAFCCLWQIFPQLCGILNSSVVRSAERLCRDGRNLTLCNTACSALVSACVCQ